MRLSDQLHCPACQSRLAAESPDLWRCTGCERAVPVVNGIADLGTSEQSGRDHDHWIHPGDLLVRMKTASGGRWPAFLGQTIAFGCDHAEATLASRSVAGLLVLDTAMDRLQACRRRTGPDPSFAGVSDYQRTIRDAVADTVICPGLLSRVSDVRAVLATAQRVLKPNGRAAFVVPNRRYIEAVCLAMAEALVQRHARDGAWPEGQPLVLDILSHARRRLLHRDDPAFLAGLDQKHLFDCETLEDLGREAGFATAEMLPLDPDPAGAASMSRLLSQAGASDGFAVEFGALAASVGQPYFDLLGRQDRSAAMLLWLTKAPGPLVCIFTAPPAPAPNGFAGADAALGGVAPHWSVELLARDTPEGIAVSLGGWCLCNADVRWIRLTLDGVVRLAPVWRPRPDVHEVMNAHGLYHPLNTLCSGMDSALLFDGVHPVDNACPFQLEIVLESGPVVTGSAPDRLPMDQPLVIGH